MGPHESAPDDRLRDEATHSCARNVTAHTNHVCHCAQQTDRCIVACRVGSPGMTPTMPDPHNLQRFVDAQESVYRNVVAELAQGRKRSHWMWFIFPQVAGLGFSAMAERFAITSREEAVAYLGHNILGPRLLECTRLVLAVKDRTIHDILGSPDDVKFRSSMTLFDAVSDDPIFQMAIAKHCHEGKDPATLDFLARHDRKD